MVDPLMPDPPVRTRFASFAEFYPYYLSEHRDSRCRRLHFAGTSLALLCLVFAMLLRNPWLIAAAPVAAYGFAWAGHLLFAHNRPATFDHPLYSLAGDLTLFLEVLRGRVRV